MFKTNKNEKIIKLAFSLNALINKIEVINCFLEK